ncbi:MAG TPA: tetratricopeptide repeat protein [Bacteroidales bacterium]|nr:tetratricopeptide repeat protein [Bacteroidales bacterium]
MRYILLILIMLVTPTDAAGQKERKQVRLGNKEYRNIQYGESELSYRRALDEDPRYNDASFNLGNSLYKQNKYEDAQERFSELSSSELDRLARAGSFYNLGNSLLKSGKIEESIEAYKNSLRLKPDNPEAKYNLAYAQDLIKQQEQQQQQQQDQEQNQDRKNDQQQQQQDQQDQENREQNDQQQQQDQQNNEEQEQQQNEQKMTKEDAERLLQALANNEKEVQEKVKKEKAARMRVRTLKNW